MSFPEVHSAIECKQRTRYVILSLLLNKQMYKQYIQLPPVQTKKSAESAYFRNCFLFFVYSITTLTTLSTHKPISCLNPMTSFSWYAPCTKGSTTASSPPSPRCSVWRKSSFPPPPQAEMPIGKMNYAPQPLHEPPTCRGDREKLRQLLFWPMHTVRSQKHYWIYQIIVEIVY